MEYSQRRYDIDWLRVISIGLLLIYHITIVFQPWGVFIGFIQSSQSLENLWIPMTMLNIWRIPLLFFVSGMGVSFAISKRNWKQLLLERTKRILIPFLFGLVVIVPLHLFIWQNYYSQNLKYILNASHLWFLANIFIYVLTLSPLFYYLVKNKNRSIVGQLKRVFTKPISLILVSIVFSIESLLIKPEIFELYAMTLHGFVLGFLAFLFGFCFVFSGELFWKMVMNKRWFLLLVSIFLYSLRFLVFDLKAPNFLMSIESSAWVFAIFGFGYKYLNKPSKALHYFSQGAYPIYILHMFFLFLGSSLILPLNVSTVVKFILILLFTSIGCFMMYELIIKRTKTLRPLFGMAQRQKRMP